MNLNSTRPNGTKYYIRALAMGLPAICFGLTLQPWIAERSYIAGGNSDFRLLYSGAWMVRNGQGSVLYDFAKQKLVQDAIVGFRDFPIPFTHPAFETLIFVPISYLSYQSAFYVWMACNVAMLLACFVALRPELDELRMMWPLLPTAIFVGFIPLSVALMQGQDSILMLLLLTFAYVAQRRQNGWLSGLLVGMGVFRFQIVLPIAFLFLLWRRWRFVLAFGFSSLISGLLCIWVSGVNGLLGYYDLLRGMSSGLNQRYEFLYGLPPTFMPNLRGLLHAILYPLGSSTHQIHTVVLLSTVACLVIAAYLGRKRESQTQLLIAVIAASLTSYHALSHDLSILLLPIIVLLSQHTQDETWLLILAIAFTFPALDMIYRSWMFLGAFAIIALLIKLLRHSSASVPSTSPELAAAV